MKISAIFKHCCPYITLAFGIILFTISALLDGSFFTQLTTKNIVSYQFTQFLALSVLFIIGFFFLKLIQEQLSDMWILLLSFPAGVCLYVFCANIFLLCDFTLRLERVLIALAVFFIALFVLRTKISKKHVKNFFNLSIPIIPTLCIIIGLLLAASSGLIYIIVNYDSFFYFSDYGITLSKYMCYKDFVSDNSYVLTNIGQFLPITGSYSGFWGLNTMFQIHHLMFVNTCIFFGYAAFEILSTNFSRKFSTYASIFASISLTVCSPFFLFGNWLLSNSWIMFFLLIAFIIANKFMFDRETIPLDISLIMCGLALAITMLRKDSLIIVSFLFICISFSWAKKRKDLPPIRKRFTNTLLLSLLYLPSAIYICLYMYLLRHVLYVTTTLAFNDSLLAPRAMILPCIAIATIIYLLFLSLPIGLLLHKYLPIAGTIALLSLIGLYAYKNIEAFIDYVDVWARNFSGIAFGFAGIQILILLVIILGVSKFHDINVFVIIGYVLLILALYWNKGNLETDVDNSGLRAMCQIIPCIYYYSLCCITKIPIIKVKDSKSA